MSDSGEVLALAREKAEEEDVADPEKVPQEDVRLAESQLDGLTLTEGRSQTLTSEGLLTKSRRKDPGYHSAQLAASLHRLEALPVGCRATQRISKRLVAYAKT